MKAVEAKETAGLKAPVVESAEWARETPVESALALTEAVLKEMVVIYRYGSLSKGHFKRLDRAGTLLLKLKGLLAEQVTAAGAGADVSAEADPR